eukprot:466265_1
MTQNNILWDSQQYLNLVKAIICHSGTKIENDYRIFNFITNFVPLSYSTLISFNSHKNGIIAQAKSPNINPMLLLLCIYTIYIGSSYNIWSEISVLFAEFVVQNRGINYKKHSFIIIKIAKSIEYHLYSINATSTNVFRYYSSLTQQPLITAPIFAYINKTSRYCLYYGKITTFIFIITIIKSITLTHTNNDNIILFTALSYGLFIAVSYNLFTAVSYGIFIAFSYGIFTTLSYIIYYVIIWYIYCIIIW